MDREQAEREARERIREINKAALVDVRRGCLLLIKIFYIIRSICHFRHPAVILPNFLHKRL